MSGHESTAFARLALQQGDGVFALQLNDARMRSLLRAEIVPPSGASIRVSGAVRLPRD